MDIEEFKKEGTIALWSKVKDTDRARAISKMERAAEKLKSDLPKKESNENMIDRLRATLSGG